MVSEFLSAAIGRLSYIPPAQAGQESAGERVYAIEIIRYSSGKGKDGWWNAEKMVELTRKAIEIFNSAFPNDIAVFAFDNSSAHVCMAQDALVANRMNMGPRG